MGEMPKGAYDELVTASLAAELAGLPPHLRALFEDLPAADAIEYLARKVADRVRQRLRATLGEEDTSITLAEGNRILQSTSTNDPAEPRLLRAILDTFATRCDLPLIPLSQSALVTNEQGLNYHALLRSELVTADRVDLICPFIGNQGLNLLSDVLPAFGDRLRVITTTYLGATSQRAIERLAGTGAQIKIVYERSDQKTALHAKAWVFHRNSGFTTGAVGSSNLSPKALVDGLEWNIRLSSKDAPQVLHELIVTFDRLWEDSKFEAYDPQVDRERLKDALKAQGGAYQPSAFYADLSPLPHQQEALDELAYARLGGRNQNLIVSATGTGKTLLSAFDYRRLCRHLGGQPRLLFIAHRKDILDQSMGAYRAVLKDGRFGESNVGSDRAGAWQHVFASIQSLHQRSLDEIAPDHFDVIVIDEFHHAEAPSYIRILDHFKPRQLLGLTATPERTDGKNVIERFGAPTYELRLWHALDRGLLCPFHYFGIDDGTDLRSVAWSANGYDASGLDRLFIDQGGARSQLIIRELFDKIEDTGRMRAVAFCTTIGHADFMASEFQRAGLAARALHSRISQEVRDELVSRFRRGDLQVICTVDLFNEGIDIPEISAVLFLRPTESATVFIQQLGRGLRNAIDKGALLVLDFVGRQNKKFRFDQRFRALTGLSRTALQRAVEDGFPMLPPGCNIQLDKASLSEVLQSIREAIPSSTRAIVDELRRMHAAGTPITVRSVLAETGLELSDLYKGRSLNMLMHAAGLNEDAVEASKRVASFIHVDDYTRVEAYRRTLEGGTTDRCWARMIAYPLTRSVSLEGIHPEVLDEMLQLLSAVVGHARPAVATDLPFALHCHYTRDEIVAPFRDRPDSMRQGTFYVEELGLDIHLVTLRKSERLFSPTTRYADYFEAEDKLHWESQSTTTATSPTGQRLIHGLGRHLFFVREDKVADGMTAPFLCLGFAKPVSATGEKPIKLSWKLDHRVPDHVYVKLKAAAG